MNNDDNRIQCPTCKTTYEKTFLIGKQGHADSCPMCGASLEEDRSDWITWWYFKIKDSDSYFLDDTPTPEYFKDYELIQEFKAPPNTAILTNLSKSRKSSAPTFQTLLSMTLSLRRQKRPAVPGAPAPTSRLFPRATALWVLAPVIPPGYVPTAGMNYNLTTFSLRETILSLFFCTYLSLQIQI